MAYGVTTTRDPQTATTDVLTYADRVDAGFIPGPRVYSTGPGVFWAEGIKSLDHARNVLRRYSDYYNTMTFKMYLAGNRQQRQWLIMAARELKLMPTTEGGLDYRLNMTHAMELSTRNDPKSGWMATRRVESTSRITNGMKPSLKVPINCSFF